MQGDEDTLTLSLTDETTADVLVVGIETVNVNINAFGTSNGGAATVQAMDVSSYSLVNNVNFDVTRSGSAINTLDMEGVASGMTVTTSDEFTTVDVSADDNAIVTLVTAANDIDAVSAGTIDDITVTTTIATGAVAIDSDADGDVVVTASTTGATTVTVDDAATVNSTTVGQLILNADAATAVTASAAGIAAASTITSDDADLAAVTLSGNGAAVIFDLRGAEEIADVTITGDQNVTVQIDSQDILALDTADTPLVMTDSSSATTTLQLIGTSEDNDLSGAAVDAIQVAADFGTETITVASGANVTMSADQTGAATITAAAATATTNAVTVTALDDDTAADTVDVNALTFTNMATVNLVLADADDAHTLTSVNFGASATANVTGNGETLTFAAGVTAGTLDIANAGAVSFGATALDVNILDLADVTGAVDVDLDGTAATDPSSITTGSGADNVNLTTTAADYAIILGAGNDTLDIDVAITSANTVTVDGGTGSNTAEIADGLDIRGISFQNMTTLDFAGTATLAESQVDGASFLIQNGAAGDAVTVSMDSADIDLSALTIVDAGGDAFDGEFTISTTGFSGLALDITGSSTIDNITGGNKNDTLDGGAGDDIVDGGAGSDVITAGAGDDLVRGGSGADQIEGGAGADLISAADGTLEVQTITVTTAAGNGEQETVTILGRDVVVTFGAGATTTTSATEIAAAINADTALYGLVVASSDAAVVTIEYLIDGDVTEVVSTENNTLAITEGTSTPGATGVAAADVITGGEGADKFIGGQGNDIFDLTETTSATDVVYLSAAANNGVDTIIGFTAGTDDIALNYEDTTVGDNTLVVVSTALATAGAAYDVSGTFDNTRDSIIEITTTLDTDVTLTASSDGSDLLEALSSDAGAVSGITMDAASDAAYILVYQGNDAFLFHGDDAGADGSLDGSEITLVGVIEDVTAGSLAAGDFI